MASAKTILWLPQANDDWMNEKFLGSQPIFKPMKSVEWSFNSNQPFANDGHWGCVIFLSIFSFTVCNIGNNNLHEFIPSSKNKLPNQFRLSSWQRWVCVSGLNFAWFTSLSKCLWCCCMLRLNSNEAALITRSSHTHLFNKNKEILLCISIKSLSLNAPWWRILSAHNKLIFL